MKVDICNTRLRTVGRVKKASVIQLVATPMPGHSLTNVMASHASAVDGVQLHHASAVRCHLYPASVRKLRDFLTAVLEAQG